MDNDVLLFILQNLRVVAKYICYTPLIYDVFKFEDISGFWYSYS